MTYMYLDDIPVSRIMNDAPITVRAFLDARLFCVGCPIAAFHTLADAAREHNLPIASLRVMMRDAMDEQEQTFNP